LQTVAIDTSVLINLAHLGRLDLLGSLPGLDFVVPEEVLGEVTEPGQRAQLEAAMQVGWARLLPLTDLAGIAIFSRQLGDATSRAGVRCRQSKPRPQRPTGAVANAGGRTAPRFARLSVKENRPVWRWPLH